MVLLQLLFALVVLATIAISVVVTRRTTQDSRARPGWTRRLGSPGRRVCAAVLITAIGWTFTIAIMVPIGIGTRSAETRFDRPIYHWIAPRVHGGHFTKLMSTLTTIGNRSTMEIVALVSVLILAIAYGRRWWLPTTMILTVVVMQREGQILLNHLVHRDHPAVADAGVFPSGGVSRLLAVYGVIVALSLALLPATQQVWRARAWTGLALFAAIEAFSRIYLSLHWTSDALTGSVFGGLLLIVSVAALNALLGPAALIDDPSASAHRPPSTSLPSGWHSPRRFGNDAG